MCPFLLPSRAVYVFKLNWFNLRMPSNFTPSQKNLSKSSFLKKRGRKKTKEKKFNKRQICKTLLSCGSSMHMMVCISIYVNLKCSNKSTCVQWGCKFFPTIGREIEGELHVLTFLIWLWWLLIWSIIVKYFSFSVWIYEEMWNKAESLLVIDIEWKKRLNELVWRRFLVVTSKPD